MFDEQTTGGIHMTRFFTTPEILAQDEPVLTGENYQHAKVLRLREGEELLLCDGQGQDCLCRVRDVEADRYVLTALSRRYSRSEPSVRVSVFMAFPKADKLEHVIQKATELGAHEIIAFPSGRCVSRPDEKSLRKKLERWQKIAVSAAEQSGRGWIPQVIALPSYAAALERAAQSDLPLLFYENEQATTLHMALESTRWESVSLMTGPEGGFDPQEIRQATAAGMRICTLGRRILRCETAPLCALSAVMYAAGEF